MHEQTRDNLKFEQLEDRIIKLREQPVLLDADVAKLHDVETRGHQQGCRKQPRQVS